jgi:Mrp family chromosome partitioning ATPase
VVIDSTPVIGIPDTCYIARYADQILFCVESAKTERKLLQRALKALDHTHTHAELLGVVMNKVDPTMLYGGYEYYKYYARHSNKQGAAKRRSREERSNIGGDFSHRL